MVGMLLLQDFLAIILLLVLAFPQGIAGFVDQLFQRRDAKS